ncbi:MAG: rhodanese-related sulfurtransferase [Planctomycetota bacterium]
MGPIDAKVATKMDVMDGEQHPICIAALYRFVHLDDHAAFRFALTERMRAGSVRGSLLLASEGINGTLAATVESMDRFLDWLRGTQWKGDYPFAALDTKLSYCETIPFRKTRVRLKREIVTMGVEGIDPNQCVGTYVDPHDWNKLIDRPDVVLIDTRNKYETEIGAFEGAVDPDTDCFRDFPSYVDENLDPEEQPCVAMYCTGGIRCEKSTAYLKQRGFKEVYHLRGGILKYLETVPASESRFQGECFVFDERVSVDHELQPGQHHLCHGCGWPVTKDMLDSDQYEAGVACPRCAADVTEDQRRRRRERQRQLNPA